MIGPYQPHPIDTSQIELDDEILRLAELLAQNVHDTWASQRMAAGWRYGATRNDVLRENPCLVPYEELPESEKQYDRHTALGTLKAVIALGYRIAKAS
jgi:hypothetical protein